MQQILAEVANEAIRFRSSYHAVNSTEENDARFDASELEIVDPVVRREREEREKHEAARSAQTDPELAEAGW